MVITQNSRGAAARTSPPRRHCTATCVRSGLSPARWARTKTTSFMSAQWEGNGYVMVISCQRRHLTVDNVAQPGVISVHVADERRRVVQANVLKSCSICFLNLVTLSSSSISLSLSQFRGHLSRYCFEMKPDADVSLILLLFLCFLGRNYWSATAAQFLLEGPKWVWVGLGIGSF